MRLPARQIRRSRHWPPRWAVSSIWYISRCSSGGFSTRRPNSVRPQALVGLSGQLLTSAALALRLPLVRRFVVEMDELIREGLFGSPAAA